MTEKLDLVTHVFHVVHTKGNRLVELENIVLVIFVLNTKSLIMMELVLNAHPIKQQLLIEEVVLLLNVLGLTRLF